MHGHTDETERLAERILAYTEDRFRLDPVPLDGPRPPEEPERDLIKRVIGLPGETLEMRAKKIYINGQPLDEPYVHFLFPPSEAGGASQPDLRERYGPVTLPANQYFMMGDNRDNSEDSRYWGFLPRENVKGKALLIYWSYDETSPTLTRWNRMFRLVH